jgi:restriction system protein
MVLLADQRSKNLQVLFKDKELKKEYLLRLDPFQRKLKNFISKIDTKIILIDGQELVELMIDHNIGVSVVRSVEMKKIDSDYFEEPA